MLRIRCAFVLMVICSSAQAQNPRAAFSEFLQVTGGPNVLNDTRPFLSFLQERPLRAGDTFQFYEQVTGAFSLTDLEMHGSRLQPFSRSWGCTVKPPELWMPCFIANVELIPRDPAFNNVPLPTSAVYDPIREVITGDFVVPAGGEYWAFQLQGRANGAFVATDPYYVFPATFNIPEPSGFVIAMFLSSALLLRRLYGCGRDNGVPLGAGPH